MQHASNSLYGRGGANTQQFREFSVVFGVVLAEIEAGGVIPIHPDIARGLLGGKEGERAAYSSSELGSGGGKVLIPKEMAEELEGQANALEGRGERGQEAKGWKAEVRRLRNEAKKLHAQSEAATVANVEAKGKIYGSKPKRMSKRQWKRERVAIASGSEGFSMKGERESVCVSLPPPPHPPSFPPPTPIPHHAAFPRHTHSSTP